MPQIDIESLDDPRLDVYRSLRKTNTTRRRNVFIAEGTTVVERLFRSRFPVQSVLITDQRLSDFRARIPEATVVYRLSKDLAALLVGYTFHMGVLAAAHRQPSPSLETTLPAAGPSMVLCGDRIIDPQNVGLLIRIASAFGADALVLTDGSADPFSRRAIRVSMGNGLFLPVVTGVEAAEVVDTTHALGYSCLGTVLSDEAVELATFTFPERCVIVFGNETHGIRDGFLSQCQHLLTVPMLNGTDSLNVAISAGIFSYAWRSRYPSSGQVENNHRQQ
ncbi:MAG: RNA methyltransferase [Planctomycetaceae bacterium]